MRARRRVRGEVSGRAPPRRTRRHRRSDSARARRPGGVVRMCAAVSRRGVGVRASRERAGRVTSGRRVGGRERGCLRPTRHQHGHGVGRPRREDGRRRRGVGAVRDRAGVGAAEGGRCDRHVRARRCPDRCGGRGSAGAARAARRHGTGYTRVSRPRFRPAERCAGAARVRARIGRWGKSPWAILRWFIQKSRWNIQRIRG